MHSTPVLGYQVFMSVVGYTFLLCFALHWLYTNVAWRRLAIFLIAAFCVNLCCCALMRPSLLSHMSVQSGMGPYPSPWINLKKLVRGTP